MGPFFEPKTKKWGFFFNIKRFINKSSLKLCLICMYTLFAGFFCHRSWRDVDQHYILVPLITNTNIVLHLIESFLKRKKKNLHFDIKALFVNSAKFKKGFIIGLVGIPTIKFSCTSNIHWGSTQGLRTPNEGINQRYLKNWADVADKICFGQT